MTAPTLPRIGLTAGLAVAVVTLTGAALAQELGGPSRDELQSGVHARPVDPTQAENPFRGSTLILDQSMTTQTADVGSRPLSRVPLYELWLSLRPRYFFDDHWSLRGRFDFTKELTNQQETTARRENVFGDVWTDLVYSTQLDSVWKGTRTYLGGRVQWPTSKASQANGTYVTLGAIGGLAHEFTLNGEDAPALDVLRVSATFAYLHPFTRATTPTDYGNFAYTRQDTDGFSFVSDQIQGQTLVANTLWAIADVGLQLTPRLTLTADGVLVNQWSYAPTESQTGATIPGTTTVTNDPTSAQFRQNVWVVGALDYKVIDELNLGLGYYNLANRNALDGQHRTLFGSDNIWWSPDARFFFDVTANLDVLYDDAVHHRYSHHETVGQPWRPGDDVRRRHIASDLR